MAGERICKEHRGGFVKREVSGQACLLIRINRERERLEARKENNSIEVLEKKGRYGTRSANGGICF